jgi:uncharacterized protein YecE (DUF72 family)
MKAFVGTSGWMYKDWAMRFYPPEVKGTAQLAYFAQHFPTVEVNSTFYRPPSEISVQNWYARTPDNFVFAVKLHQKMTRYKHLLPDEETDAALDDFLRRVQHLREKLAVILVQLPPSMKLDIARIEHLARQVKKGEKKYGQQFRLAIECRHASWFTPEYFAALRRLNIANVVIDSPGRWPASREITSDLAYIRFHGSKKLYASSYTDKELRAWADFIQENCAAAGCQKVFAYFNNDHNAFAVDNARTLTGFLHDT